MRTTLLIERYRKFAARTHLSMALLALTLFAAIGVLFAVGARASHAAFLDAEARNFTSLGTAEDMTLVAAVAITFAGSAALTFMRPRRRQ